jgi:hypothetical protein
LREHQFVAVAGWAKDAKKKTGKFWNAIILKDLGRGDLREVWN